MPQMVSDETATSTFENEKNQVRQPCKAGKQLLYSKKPKEDHRPSRVCLGKKKKERDP